MLVRVWGYQVAHEQSWRDFLATHRADYEQLGARLAGLTSSQEELA